MLEERARKQAESKARKAGVDAADLEDVDVASHVGMLKVSEYAWTALQYLFVY